MNTESNVYQDLIQKPVLVIGASGYFGGNIARQLAAEGRRVRVMLRKSSNTAGLEGLDVERCYGDVSDSESLRAAMRGCGTVYYSVVDTRAWLTDPSPLYRCNVDGLVNAMDAALLEGIERFMFTSSMATIGRVKEGKAKESDAFNWWDVAPHYIRSRVAAEEKLFEYYREKGLQGIALCVANTYGPDDYQPTPHGKLLWQAAKGKVPIALDCGAPTVDIRDAAQAALLAERYGRVGERYIVANEFISQPQLYALGAARFGNKTPKTMSLRMAYFIATISECLSKLFGRKDVQLCRDSIFLSEVFGPLDNSKAVEELGWHPRPIEETVNDAIDWFASHRRASASKVTTA